MSENKLKGLELHSEPVQDIIGRPPGWMVRSGITMIFIILALLMLGCCLIKYPEILSAKIRINAYNLPAQVKARSTGRGRKRGGERGQESWVDSLPLRQTDFLCPGTFFLLITEDDMRRCGYIRIKSPPSPEVEHLGTAGMLQG